MEEIQRMKAGVFHVPYMKPERSSRATFEYSIQCAIEADKAGFVDFMVGEHATQAWENIPNPEVVIGAAALQTQSIRFAPMAHLLPLHFPGSLAIQTGWLSQVLEGRYFLGVGAGAYGRDAMLRGQPDDLSEAHPRMEEALSIIKRIWRREPFEYNGTFYDASFPDEHAIGVPGVDAEEGGDVHTMSNFMPWDGPDGPEIAVTGLSLNSGSLRWAGANGFQPISFFGGSALLKSHWDTYASAAEAAGHPTDRSRFRVCRDVFVADTDEEARRRAIDGAVGETWRRYLVPIYKRFGIFEGYVADSGTGVEASEIDMDWLAEHVWLCGSPETVARKIDETIDKAGPWGTLCMNTHDAVDDPAPWFESMHRLAKEVLPNVEASIAA
jgi:alkanesulfonate monooxygenase SsuD/methylene tetrahydromethanopterin reductase-like flavin-dependent oxidoreductase (luciferase family)